MYENDVKAYFVVEIAMESTYNTKHRHLASELQRIYGTKPSRITYSLGHCLVLLTQGKHDSVFKVVFSVFSYRKNIRQTSL